MRIHGNLWGQSSLALGIALAFGCNTASESASSGESFSDSDILVARSTDAGLTWTEPAALNLDAATDFGVDESPQLTTDGEGVWLAVWQSTSFAPLVRHDFDVLVSHSADDGASWMDQAELNSEAATDMPTEGDISPQLTTDGDGNWVAVWASTAGYNLPPPPPPDVPVPPDLDILVARSTDDGATWTPQVALNSNAADDDGFDEHPQVITDGDETWLAVWNSNEGYNKPCPKDPCKPGDRIPRDHDILFARSTDAGATWSASAALNTKAVDDGDKRLSKKGGTDKHPQVATDGAGTWVAVWHSDQDYTWPATAVHEQADYDILFARSTDAGATWSAQVALNSRAAIDAALIFLVIPPEPGLKKLSDGGEDAHPQVTTDGAGTWVAVWQSDEGYNRPWSPPVLPRPDYDILFARSEDGGVTWTEQTALNTNAADDAGHDTLPQLTTDGQGTWVAVWESDDALDGTIGTDADILFARSEDDGVTWSAPAPLNTDAAGDSENDASPQLTTDEQGNWVAVWQSMESL